MDNSFSMVPCEFIPGISVDVVSTLFFLIARFKFLR